MSSGRIPRITGPSLRSPARGPSGTSSSPAWNTPPSIRPSMVFIAGRPMNSATNRVFGR